jgi:DNA modification methylase
VKPYYEDTKAGIVIYHGDCLEVLPHVKADVLDTDPPFGVELGARRTLKQLRAGGGRRGLYRAGYASYEDTYENFVTLIVPRLNAWLDSTKRGLVWTGPHIHEQRKPSVIGGVYCPAGSGRHPWGFKTFLPVLLYGLSPHISKGAPIPSVIRSSERSEKISDAHPCPKPLGWVKWSISLASLPSETIVDPFMGSGTTLRAAKDLGRKAVGIEIDERYCEIAAKRLAQEVLCA